jgi:hypothetical protein
MIKECYVYWKTPANRMKHRNFPDKESASRWVLKRLPDPRFRFNHICGSTWVVWNLETIKEWSK